MSIVGLDPVAAPSLARALDDASAALGGQSARLAVLLGEAGQGEEIAATVREIGRLLDEEADDLRRRVRGVLDDVEGFLAEVWAFLGGDVLSLWNGGPGENMPWGRWLAGVSKEQSMLKFLRAGGYVIEGSNPLPLFNAGRVGLALRGLPSMGWMGSGAVTGVLKWGGVAGGLYTGVSGTVNLVRQGNPVDAYRREGAGYVADVAGTALGYSSAAFLVAPNPFTGAAVVGTGVVWLGAEGWDHHHEIVAAWDTAAGWAADRAVSLARDAAAGAGQAVDVAVQGAGVLAGEMVDMAGNAVGLAGGVGDMVGGMVDRAADTAGTALEGARYVAGSAVNGAGTAAGAVVDGVGQAAGAALDRLWFR